MNNVSFVNLSAEDLRKKNTYLDRNRMIDARTATILFSDGTVKALAFNQDVRYNVSCMVAVTGIASAAYAVYGLCVDGTVFSSNLMDGRFLWKNKNDNCIPGWNDIVAVSGGSNRAVAGLKKDGTVLLYECSDIVLEPSVWFDIVQIAFGDYHLVGLKKDGTVVVAGENGYGQCNVSGWSDIVHIAAGNGHTVGVKADGTVVAVGDNSSGQCEVSGWTNMARVSASVRHTVGLGTNGEVVATVYKGEPDFYGGQCDVTGWSDYDVVDISAGPLQTLGIKRNGDLITTVPQGMARSEEQFSRCFKIVGIGKLFDNYDNLTEERKIKMTQSAKQKELEDIATERRWKGVCQYCGGSFKGFFSKICTSCGKKKDY